MTAGVLQLLIVCPLVFLGGFVDAVAGGGGLITLPAYMISGFPVHYAIGTNKLSSAMGTTLTVGRFAKKGYIPWKQALSCVVCALIGARIGAKIALLLDDSVFKIIMLFVLPLTAAYVFFGKAFVEEKESYSMKKTIALSMLISLGIGIYDGFYGPGTGTFLILFLTGAAHMKLKEANGVAKVINLTTNLSALAVYLSSGKVLIGFGLLAGVFGIAGNYIGTRVFERSGAKTVKPLIIVVLAVFFVKVLLEFAALFL